jgi:hypothetical protein
MTNQTPTRFAAAGLILAGLCFAPIPRLALAQQKPLPMDAPATTPHRTRLIMKDGSYQIIMSYRVVGNIVHYISAERGGTEEEVPASLVDFEATKHWEARHTTPDPSAAPGQAPTIDPELLKEEADRAALTPEVVTDLRLPEEDSVLGLDYFHGTPELVPMAQSGGDLNRNTAHNLIRTTINPLSSSHMILQLKGETAPIQMHVDSPVIYLRIGDTPAPPTGGAPFVVDTAGATGQAPTAPSGGSPNSRYVIVRTDVRNGIRVIASFKISYLGGVRRQEDVVETTTELLPGGHWMKITPRNPLEFGEFALMEVLSDKDVNLGVWDFGVHPVAPENRDVMKPEPRRRNLERRTPTNQ